MREGGLGEGQGFWRAHRLGVLPASTSNASAALTTRCGDTSHTGTQPPPQDGGQGQWSLVRERMEYQRTRRADTLAGAASLGLIVAE